MRNKKENLYVILILIMLFGVSIGYAVLTKTLNITGNSSVRENTWDIHFENVKVTSGSVDASRPSFNNSNLAVNFNFFLNLPGDFYEFTVEIHNDGSIDAMIDSITKTPELTDRQKKYVNYIIEYENGEQIASNQLIKAGEAVRLKVRVEYRSDVLESDMPTTNETLNLGFTVNYLQADNNGVHVKDNGAWVAKADASLDEIGTIVTIGDQQFYTIGIEGENVKLLSMYNLYVGGSYDGSNWFEYGKEATGMQDKNMLGLNSNGLSCEGTTSFSSSSQMGTNYSDYKGSIVEGYVNNYKSILEGKFGIQIEEARLVTHEELTDLETFACADYGSCSSKYPWIYSMTYWTQSFYNNTYIWCIVNGNTSSLTLGYYHGYKVGIRPVIVMKKSDIKVEVKPVADGSLDEIGTIVTIGTEQFYTIGRDGDNVKLLSMYNLYVGNECTYDGTSLCTPYGGEADGLQEENMRGYIHDQISRKGTTVFSSEFKKGLNYSDYEGSIVEGYVNNYKIEIERMGVNVEEARLITKDELISEEIGCSISNNSCSEAPNFIYATSYWSNSANDTEYIWRVDGVGRFIPSKYSLDDYVGVRPVIVISKSLF